jgi:TPP-dependent pyruvate/acetoin dehydrogenase alpha subunit
MRAAYGLPPDPTLQSEILNTANLQTGENDMLLLGALESNAVDIQTKVKTIDRLHEAIFDNDENDQYDQNRVGRFLQTATKLYKDKNAPDQLRQELYSRITPILLEDVAKESSVYRWAADNTEATLNAYCTLQTIERKYKDAQNIYRKIAIELVYAREFDLVLERAAGDVSKQSRGTVIYLGARGAEMAQTVAKHAFRTTCQENHAQAVIAPYYRDHVLETNLGEGSEDPQGDLLSPDEAIANLCRIEGGTRSTGVELNVPSKINRVGKISVFPATPNVGGHILAASGYADALRLNAIRQNCILYDKPERANAYRNIRLNNTEAAVLISLGDGAYLELDSALEFQVNNRTPVINFTQNNGVAIGVELDEVVPQGKLYQKGHGKEVPGIRIDETDMDGLYFAVQFATQRALLDAGPTIVEAMTRRLLPHSNAHGDHLTSEYIIQAMQILEKNIERMPQDDPRQHEIKGFIEKGLMRATGNDNQIRLKQRLRDLLSLSLLDRQAEEEITTIDNNIVDPVQTSLAYLQDNGYITEDEVEKWENQARHKMENILQEALARPGPKPKQATSNIRLETPRITGLESSPKRVKLNTSEAIQLAIKETMEINPNVLLRGVDVYKGLSI